MSSQRMNPDLYKQAKDMFTPEQRKNYKKMGENFYGGVDFVSSTITSNPDLLVESAAYIIEGLKSGMSVEAGFTFPLQNAG